MRSLTESFANMGQETVEVVPILDWMHRHWGCTCARAEVVFAIHADGSGGLRIVHEEGCAVVVERVTACN